MPAILEQRPKIRSNSFRRQHVQTWPLSSHDRKGEGGDVAVLPDRGRLTKENLVEQLTKEDLVEQHSAGEDVRGQAAACVRPDLWGQVPVTADAARQM
eukprot:CAMPEP_0177435628 /NCGR_PEP_ID=MMETSP0369-20130122/1194_1 /TAXON_ID=447022 ORGANISM="Scrippsiella hangoei-like, Strain SHHI-4" /NCGR_SAMPLE_ID=MMETSP0369 /ASSEMBLY_ACC=CAM_ASM_000364 /LENGTH=97 /DNA_ID=CAMNT_0018906883 /DNA_START=25 /DNA_END=318 /DNA_ORIENTATION=-